MSFAGESRQLSPPDHRSDPTWNLSRFVRVGPARARALAGVSRVASGSSIHRRFRARHPRSERGVRTVNVVCWFAFSMPARSREKEEKSASRSDARAGRGRAPRRRRARDARRDAPRRVSARGEGRERSVAFGDARTKRGGSRGRARVPAAVAASRMGFVPWLFVYANPKAKPPPRHALASALWLRTRMFPTVIVEGGGVVPAFGRPRGGRPRSGARARAGGLAGGAANGRRKKARGPWNKGRAGLPQRPRSGSVVRKRTGDGAPRPRDPRAFGKRRRAPEEAERACFAAAFEAAARRASVGVAASATRPEERWRMGGVSRHACRSFVLADLRPRSRDFPNDGTGGLDRRRLGSRRERLSPNADRNDARRSIEPNEPPDSSSS